MVGGFNVSCATNDSIYLLGVTEFYRHVWRLRAHPIAFISSPTERKKSHINNFV